MEGDMELFRQLDNRQTDRQLFLKLLLRLKKFIWKQELERYGAMPVGLTQTNEIASKSQRDGAKPDGLTQTIEIASKHRERQRGDMELFRQLGDGQTDKQTNGQTDKRTYRAIP